MRRERIGRLAVSLGVVVVVAAGCEFAITPESGPAGTVVTASGVGEDTGGCPSLDDYQPGEAESFLVEVTLFSPDDVAIDSGTTEPSAPNGAWSLDLTIPDDAEPGEEYWFDAVCQVFIEGELANEIAMLNFPVFAVTESPTTTTTSTTVAPTSTTEATTTTTEAAPTSTTAAPTPTTTPAPAAQPQAQQPAYTG